jgi:hypothetical protein
MDQRAILETLLSYEVVDMLRWLREGLSFKEIAVKVYKDERTVSHKLRAADEAFYKLQHDHILEREPGRKGYRLTTAGETLANRLEPHAEAMAGALVDAAAAAKRIPILCTSNCTEYLIELLEALPADSGFVISPLPKRTADIDLASTRGTRPQSRLCLLSALMSFEQESTDIRSVMRWNDSIEVLPLRLEPLQLLAGEDLRLAGPVTVQEVFDEGVTFLTPHGGVAWDFLNRAFPDWKWLRPHQHIDVQDLDFGLKCLVLRRRSTRAMPRCAMIVHGLNPSIYETYGLKDPYLYDFEDTGSRHLVAVTGVFYIQPEDGKVDPSDPYEQVWHVAQALWSESERKSS